MLGLVALPPEGLIRIGASRQPGRLDCASYSLTPHRNRSRGLPHPAPSAESHPKIQQGNTVQGFEIAHRLTLEIPRITYSTQKHLAGARVECAALIIDGYGWGMLCVPT